MGRAFLIALLLSPFCGGQEPEKIPTPNGATVKESRSDLPTTLTVKGKTYEKITWGAVSLTAVSIKHESGAASLQLTSLPEELQRRLGYDPQKVADYNAKVAEEARQRVQVAKENEERLKQMRRGGIEEIAPGEFVVREPQDHPSQDETPLNNAQLAEELGQRKSLQSEISLIRSELSALKMENASLDGAINQQRKTGQQSPASARRNSLLKQIEAKKRFLKAKEDQLQEVR